MKGFWLVIPAVITARYYWYKSEEARKNLRLMEAAEGGEDCAQMVQQALAQQAQNSEGNNVFDLAFVKSLYTQFSNTLEGQGLSFEDFKNQLKEALAEQGINLAE